LIGQLSDPRYLKKISSLFYEFEEVGTNKVLGYKTPGDLRQNYAKFYWNGVFPYIPAALKYLELTQEGKQIVANLYANVFQVENESRILQGINQFPAEVNGGNRNDQNKGNDSTDQKSFELTGLNL